MRIEHVAVWTRDLERSRAFYERWLGARAGTRYERPGFASHFLTFESGARLELMQGDGSGGGAHFAMALGSERAVDELTAALAAEGVAVLDGPRRTGDGYYESVVLDPDGNRVELTV